MKTHLQIVGMTLCILTAAAGAAAQTGAVKTAIDAANKKFGAAIAAGDAAGVAGIYTDDAMVLPPNMEAIKGKAAIEKVFQGLIVVGIKSATLTAQDVESHGDTATEIGSYSLMNAAGKEIDRGKYIAIWKRVQGQWKMHRDIWNSSLPLAPAK
jgi:uncharacterized protein (TIGR02246 family)